MFTTVNFIYPPERFFAKIKFNLLPPPIKVQRISVPEGSDFLQADVPVIRGKVYWSNVYSNIGKAGQNLLLPKSTNFKEFGELKRFKAERFYRYLCINSSIKLLSLLPKMCLPHEVSVIDFCASCAPLLESLPKFCRSLKVITNREEKYERLKQSAMQEYGCAIIATPDISRAFTSPVIIMPDGSGKAVAFSRKSLIFSPFSDNIYSSNVFTMNGVSMDKKYLDLLPTGIEPCEFAAALYEQSETNSLKNSVCSSFKQGNVILSYKDIIELISAR